MRILVFGDTHFGLKLGKTGYSKAQSIKEAFKAFEQIINLTETEKIDVVIHVGDVFDRSKPDKKIVHKAYSLFERLLNTGVKFIIIPGNHDRSTLDNTLLEQIYPNFHILNSLGSVNYEDWNFVGFPFTKSPQQTLELAFQIAEEKKQFKTIVFCHQTFIGAEVGPQNFKFNLKHNAVVVNKLPVNVPFIVSGHIHRAQILQDGKVIYPGSVIRTSFQEYIEPKGVLIIDEEGGTLTVNFKEIESSTLEVVEVRYDELDKTLREIDPQIRTLVRVIDKSFERHELIEMYKKVSLSQLPLLHLSPNQENVVLKPLYSTYKGSFLPFHHTLDLHLV